jgi:hypothetical protein
MERREQAAEMVELKGQLAGIANHLKQLDR